MPILPFDILGLILQNLANRKDWLACATVSTVFNRAVNPLLYRTLDVRVISRSLSSHPATTLIRRPDLALFVRHVTETGQLHRALLSRNAGSVTEVLEALSLCKNLTSFTWIDDYTESDLLRSFLAALRRLFVQDVTIRTHSELGDPVWSEIIRLGRLEKLSIWCMFGPSDLLQCSTVAFKDTLTHLEIGVSHFTDSCADLVRSLPLLTDLRLKGAGTTTVSAIVSSLPNLQSLDSDYLTSRSGSWPSIDRLPSISGTSGTGRPMPNIRSLTIRPNSHILHNLGPWLLNSIVPSTGLESLKLHCLVRAQSQISLPSAFLVDLASKHRATLKHLVVGDIVLIPDEIQYICEEFPNLETLDCSVKLSDLSSVTAAVNHGRNLVSLHMHIPLKAIGLGWRTGQVKAPLSAPDAQRLMLHHEDSRLRRIVVGRITYEGRWVASTDSTRSFEVSTTVEDNQKWDT